THASAQRMRRSACNPLNQRSYWARHLWRELAEKISRAREPQLERRSLSGMGYVIEARGKVRISCKSGRRGADKVRDRGHGVPGVRPVHQRERECMHTSREYVMAALRKVAGVLM